MSTFFKEGDSMFTGFDLKKFSVGFLLIAVLIALSISLGAEGIVSFDTQIQEFVLQQRSADLTPIYTTFTHLGDFWFYVVVCVVLLAIKDTRFTYGIPVTFNNIIAAIARLIINHAVARPRPDEALRLVTETSYSFPSGHSLNSFVLCGTLFFLFEYYYQNNGASLKIYTVNPHRCERYIHDSRKLGLVGLMMLLYVFFMAYSRLYVGVHWPTDIAGGWLLAGIVLCFF